MSAPLSDVTLPPRAEIPVEQTWDLASVYPSDDAWEDAARKALAAVPNLTRGQRQLGAAPDVLLEALRARDQWTTVGWRLRQYANMQVKADASDPAANERLQRANNIRARINAALAWMEPEICALEQARLDEMLAAAPDLAAYTHALEDMRARRRTTAPPELLTEIESLTETFYVTYKTLVSSELRFASPRDSHGVAHLLTPATFHALMRQPDRTLRQATYEAHADGFGALGQTFANLLAGTFSGQSTLAAARGYSSALDAALDAGGLLRAGDGPGVFATLLDTCQRRLPLWHRYYDLRRRALGLETLRPWDMDVSLAPDAPGISYDEARATILAAVAPLGDDYVAVLRRGLYEERWVDWATNAGKLAGAEQSGCWGTHPFVLLSWESSVISMSALAHELGHAMHMHYTWRDQLPLYDEVMDYLSETASTFHQALLRAHILRTSTDAALRRAILSEALTYYERYLLIMPLLARFEMEGHQRLEQGQSLGARWLTDRTLELFREAYGPAVTLDDEREGLVWAQMPHLHLNFYVYQYTLGLASANLLADAVLREGEPAAARYRRLISLGSSVYPLDALSEAGADLTTPEPLERAFATLEAMLDELEALVDQDGGR
ncbi:MAG TPA: M3 family oligoendopeptidase [Ktedonobacterales bacterium]|nr:M3 family oligoendopeptidase [Ktedonobacterales bacterium]